jgi:hypothetical protein
MQRARVSPCACTAFAGVRDDASVFPRLPSFRRHASARGHCLGAGQCLRVVRFRHLRHVRRRDFAAVLPHRRHRDVAAAGAGHLWRGLCSAPDRRPGVGHVRRPPRPPSRAVTDDPDDGRRHRPDRPAAYLCLHRRGGQRADVVGAADSGVFRGWRIRQRQRDAGGVRPHGAARPVRQLSDVLTVAGVFSRGRRGLPAVLEPVDGGPGKLGLARALPVRHPDRPHWLLPAHAGGRNA